jgi:hypothetical protein
MDVSEKLQAPATIPFGKVSGSHRNEGWAGPPAGLATAVNSQPGIDTRFSGRPAHSLVTVTTG